MSKIEQIKEGLTLYDLPTTAQDISYSGSVSGATTVKAALDTLAGGGGSSKTTDIIVAASNSTDAKKAIADYVCDGANDEVQIQSAINSAISDKKSVKLMQGTYYLDAASKTYVSSNDCFLLIDTSPDSGSTSSKGVTIYGEDPFNRPILRVSNDCYTGLSSSTQYRVIGVKDTTNYGGFVELRNLNIGIPSNQKKVIGVDMYNYGGWARMHSVGLYSFVSSYNDNKAITDSSFATAADGSIGIRFIAKGPNGAYGSEITDCGVTAFNEGISLNTEWTVLNHVYSIQCITGWVFGKYTRTSGAGAWATCHPLVLICCGDERGRNLPVFYNNQQVGSTDGLQQIEMIGFSIERYASTTPGGSLGELAKEITIGKMRGNISYTIGTGVSGGNSVGMAFWKSGHGHGVKTSNAAQEHSGTTATRASYAPNYMQTYYDTDLGKMLVCTSESTPTWKDMDGTTVTNSTS